MLCSQKNKQIILMLEPFSSLFWYRKCACRSSISQAMLQVRNSACSPPIHATQIPPTPKPVVDMCILLGMMGLAVVMRGAASSW